MKKLWILILFFAIFAITGCDVTQTEGDKMEKKGSVMRENVSVFPKQRKGYIGDPMPFFDNGVMNVFYLHDARDGDRGFHPWYLYQTTDFTNWVDKGEAIPYVNNYASQDLALGTGSVVKATDGIYHAYYTGFNGTGNVDYKEMIQHATSNDLINWTKHPEHGFYGGQDDFRDPYVFFMEEDQQYWMLITTRDAGKGVIKLYKSENLINWKDHGVFFKNDMGSFNLECPSVIYHNGYWYLTFSEQGEHRVLHYRYKKDWSSTWIRPERDYFDEEGFYAGRLERGWDRLFAFGWVGTKEGEVNGGKYAWAGNLVTHEIKQRSNGELYPVIVAEVDALLSTEVRYPVTQRSNTLLVEDKTVIFDEKQGFQYYLFEALESKPTKMVFDLEISNTGIFGLTFQVLDKVNYGSMNIVFQLDHARIEFYDVNPFEFTLKKAQMSMPFIIGANNKIRCVVLLEGECLTIYVNDDVAFTTRIYDMSGYEFGFFSKLSGTKMTNIHFYE